MVSRKEMQKIVRMVHIIKLRGTIHRWDLIDEAKISINTYNQLKSYMQHKFEEKVKYDKGFEEWKYIYQEPKQKEEIQKELPEQQ